MFFRGQYPISITMNYKIIFLYWLNMPWILFQIVKLHNYRNEIHYLLFFTLSHREKLLEVAPFGNLGQSFQESHVLVKSLGQVWGFCQAHRNKQPQVDSQLRPDGETVKYLLPVRTSSLEENAHCGLMKEFSSLEEMAPEAAGHCWDMVGLVQLNNGGSIKTGDTMLQPVASQVSEQVCRAKWDVYFCSLYLCSHGCKFLSPPFIHMFLCVCLCMFPTKQHYPANNLSCLFCYDLLFDCCLVSLHSDSRNRRCVCVCVSPSSLSWMGLQVSLKQATSVNDQHYPLVMPHSVRTY